VIYIRDVNHMTNHHPERLPAGRQEAKDLRTEIADQQAHYNNKGKEQQR
jgi:hypothetical protein